MLVLLAHGANADGDAERGEDLAYTCLGCHGIEGYRNAYPSYRVPKLGGQTAGYIVAAFRGYKNGEREHSTMHAQAVSVPDQDLLDIAAYIETLGAETVQAGGADNVPSLDIAATCVACHGENGITKLPNHPSLAGQHEDYLKHALKGYRDGERKNLIMMPMAANLSDDQIAVLAEYYASMPGLETTKKQD